MKFQATNWLFLYVKRTDLRQFFTYMYTYTRLYVLRSIKNIYINAILSDILRTRSSLSFCCLRFGICKRSTNERKKINNNRWYLSLSDSRFILRVLLLFLRKFFFSLFFLSFLIWFCVCIILIHFLFISCFYFTLCFHLSIIIIILKKQPLANEPL